MKNSPTLSYRIIALLVMAIAMIALPVQKLPAAGIDEDTDKFTKDISPELDKKIKNAIVKGIEYLKSKQKADGSWEPASVQIVGGGTHSFPVGHTALCTYALIQSGENKFGKSVTAAFDWMRKQKLK